MPRMSQRNRKRRKVAVKLPGAKTVIKFLSRKPAKARCAETGQELHGIPRGDPVKMKRLPKTAKRPERPYGGVLSSKAMRSKIKMEAKMETGSESKPVDKIADVGMLCVKIAGRDAGLHCVVVDVIDSNFVMIDGQTRRRKCNINHVEPLNKILKIKKGASTADVKKEFEKLGFEMSASKPKKTPARLKKIKVSKKKVVKELVKKDAPAKKEPVKNAEKAEKKPVKKAPAKK